MNAQWFQDHKAKFLEQLFQRSLFATAILDKQEIVLDINLQFSQLFGYKREEAIGFFINDLIVPETYELEATTYKRIIFGKNTMRSKTKRQNKDGILLDVEAVGSPVILDGKVQGLFAMYRDIRVEEETLREMNRLLHIDPLTNLYNRKYIYERIHEQIQQDQHPFVLFYLDLDEFKEINDTYGHEAGDEVLKEAARRLNTTIGENGEVARIGGDEFLLLVEEGNHCISQALETSLRHALNKPYLLGTKTLNILASMGTASFPEDGKDADKLISVADKKMYEEKKQRRIRRNPFRQEP